MVGDGKMNIESLLTRMSDTGLENETLLSVMNSLLENGTINVRRLCLSTDRKVKSNGELLNKDIIISNEVIIFKSIVNKLEELDVERLNSFGINNIIIAKLKSLTDEQIKSYKNFIPINDKSLSKSINLIHHMSKIDDMFGSITQDLFEKHVQNTHFINMPERTVQYTKRIYLNIPLNKIGIEFLTLFKLKCIEKGIPSKMKGLGSSGFDEGDLDTTIIYSNDYYLLDHINILESLIKERPDLFENFGTPVLSGARVKSNNGECYYTISSGILNDNTSNGYYDDLYKISFAILCEKYNNGIDLNIEQIAIYSNMKSKEFNNFIFNQKNILAENLKNKNLNVENLIEDYKQIVKNVSSYLRFGDLHHLEVPLYQDEIFVNFLGKSKVEDTKTKSNANIETKPEFIILFQTESLVDSILEEFSNSNLSNNDKAINYINKINDLFRKFEVYSRLANGFREDSRYIEVQEYFRNIPMFQLYQQDTTKGNGYNYVLASRYYNEVVSTINSYIETKRNAKKM